MGKHSWQRLEQGGTKYTSPPPPLSPDEPGAGIKIHFHFKETGESCNSQRRIRVSVIGGLDHYWTSDNSFCARCEEIGYPLFLQIENFHFLLQDVSFQNMILYKEILEGGPSKRNTLYRLTTFYLFGNFLFELFVIVGEAEYGGQ